MKEPKRTKPNHSQRRQGEQNLTKPDTLPEKRGIEVSGQDDLSGLTSRQREALPFLIGARSLEAGCEDAGITRTTYYEWLKDPKFKSELERLQSEIVRDALDRLKRTLRKAVDGLAELVTAPEKNIRIRAIESALEYFFKSKELDLEARISELEKNLAVYNERKRG